MSEASAIGNLVLAGTQLITFLVLWRKISGVTERREVYPQPLTVRADEKHVTEATCLRQHAEAAQRFDRMEAKYEARAESSRMEIKQDIKAVHARIDDILGEVRGLAARLDEMGKRR